jgi:hypothetical protein
VEHDGAVTFCDEKSQSEGEEERARRTDKGLSALRRASGHSQSAYIGCITLQISLQLPIGCHVPSHIISVSTRTRGRAYLVLPTGTSTAVELYSSTISPADYQRSPT